MKKFLVLFLAATFVSSLSTQVFSDDRKDEANYHYETMKIEFDKNSSALDQNSRRKLRNKVQSLKQGDRLEEITIAAYSDRNYPPKADQKLSDRDKDLADKRIESVKEAVSDLEGIGIDVESYNLAKDPNPIQKFFGTSDQKLKSKMKGNNIEKAPQNLSLITEEGEVQTALVVFKVKTSGKTTKKATKKASK